MSALTQRSSMNYARHRPYRQGQQEDKYHGGAVGSSTSKAPISTLPMHGEGLCLLPQKDKTLDPKCRCLFSKLQGWRGGSRGNFKPLSIESGIESLSFLCKQVSRMYKETPKVCRCQYSNLYSMYHPKGIIEVK